MNGRFSGHCFRKQLRIGRGWSIATVRFVPIVLQKSKLAVVQIFGENQKRKEADDSYSLSRATEVAHEFGAWRRGPPRHYSIAARTGQRIWVPPRKKTFATISAKSNRFDRLPTTWYTPDERTFSGGQVSKVPISDERGDLHPISASAKLE
jgi:hypothetical protein